MLFWLKAGDGKPGVPFQQIYEENYKQMYHVAFGILKSPAEAENAVQEAFFSIARNYRTYSGICGRKLTALCITIVRNKCIDEIRRQEHFDGKDPEELVLCSMDADIQPEAHMQRREQKELLQRGMSRLPEALYTVLVLKYYQEFSIREIAKQLELSEKTVEMRLYRAKKKMRELLEQEGFERY